MFKVNIKTPEQWPWRHSGIFIVNFEGYFTHCSGGSINDVEQVNAGWVGIYIEPYR